MRKILIVSVFAMANTVFLLGQVKTASDCYDLVWSDEFDTDGGINENYWNIEVNGDGGGNNELQYYTNRKENVRQEKGNLVIEAIKENYLGKAYTSARITTQKKLFWKFGKIEARMKLPFGKGIWPAYWMVGEAISTAGWPNCGEMDIMELVGGTGGDNTVHSTFHWGPTDATGGHPSYGLANTLSTGKFADDFHTFTLEWDAQKARVYRDNIKMYEIDITSAGLKAFRENFFLIFNLAVGGNWPGSPDAKTIFPQAMLIDYIRVYKKIDELKITGKTEVNENEENLTYAIASNAHDITYTWQLPANAVAQSRLDSNAVTLKWPCTDDSVKVILSGTCSTVTTFVPVTVKPIKISGKRWIDQNGAIETYTVNPISGASYSWSSANGITFTSPNDTSAIKAEIKAEGFVKVGVTTLCGTRYDSIEVKFGDGQFPYPDAEKPAPIPGKIVAGNYDTGGEGKAYHDVDAGNNGNTGRLTENVDLEANDNSTTVGWFDSGEWIEYTVETATAGTYKATIRVASQPGSTGFEIYEDNVKVTSKTAVPATGSWATFKTITVENIKLTAGKHILKIYSYGGFNLGDMLFEKSSSVPKVAVQGRFGIFPNPASSTVNIEIRGNVKADYVQIVSLEGKTLLTKTLQANSQAINIETLPKGVYTIRITNTDQAFVSKLLVQ